MGYFKTELEALIYLENYKKNPTTLYIKESIYNKITTFSQIPYSLIAVDNPKKEIVEKIKSENYTFKQLYHKFSETKMLTKEEADTEKKYHIRPKNKPFSRNYCLGMITAYHNSTGLYNRVYKDLRASDFNKYIKESKKKPDAQRQMANLYMNLDRFALEEDIIQKGYAQYIVLNINTHKNIKKANKAGKIDKERLFSYSQIDYLWNFKPKNKDNLRKQKELFVRDFWLMLLYTGMRAEELLSLYTVNIFLDDNYIIGGLKTKAGTNRTIPLHKDIKPLFQKYYNKDNEFLFMQSNGNRINYDYYLYHYKNNFKDLHPYVSEHTAHDARHTLRNELRKVNVKDIIINSIIGHSNDDVGEDIYSHISLEEKIEAINLITYKKNNNLYILSNAINE